MDLTNSFWSWPFHFGCDQIIMVKSKSIWWDQNHLVRPKPFLTDQNCFGHIEGQGIRAYCPNIYAVVSGDLQVATRMIYGFCRKQICNTFYLKRGYFCHAIKSKLRIFRVHPVMYVFANFLMICWLAWSRTTRIYLEEGCSGRSSNPGPASKERRNK